MNIIFLILSLFINYFCFGLSNPQGNDELLLKLGKHFNCVFPNWVGTLIHPQWCLACAHAAPTVGTAIEVDGKKFFVEKVILHPLYHIASNPHEYDFSLVKINEPILTRPFIKRARDDTKGSSLRWVASAKGGELKAGVIYAPVHIENNRFYRMSQGKGNIAVCVEHGDSGSPAFSFPAKYNNYSLPPLNELELTGVVITMGSILRLPHTGINEFIDMIQLKDALGDNVNALVNMLTLKHALGGK